MEIFDRFMKAYNLAKSYNDAGQAALAVALLREARANNMSWANAYRITPGRNVAPYDVIKPKNFLNPYAQDTRNWTVYDVLRDYELRLNCGVPAPKNFVSPDNRKTVKAYADFLRRITPQPDRISGVYMMFQHDMKYGHCVKIGSSSDCADRQNQYITCNPFTTKGPMKAVDNPREVEKRYHEILAERFENVETSREWFAVDYTTYKKLKKEGFGFFERYFKGE